MSQEDFERAHAYALISQLFRAAPGADLLYRYSPPPPDPEVKFTLHQIEAVGKDAALGAFQAACAEHDVEDIAAEYRALFESLGSSLVSPAAPQALTALREHLRACGLPPAQAYAGVEFYVSGVCDVLEWLIEHDRPRAVQAAFFDEFVDTGVMAVCDAIDEFPGATYYRAVAGLVRSFIADERSLLAETDT